MWHCTFAKESNKTQDADRLYNMFLTNQYVQNESSKLNKKQTDTNSLAFQAIMGNSKMNLLHSLM
jgi:hypothetical protein